MYRIVIALLIVCLFVDTAGALPGSGTQQDPWRIQSLSDFDEFAADANYWAGYTLLKTDINLVGRIYTTAVIAPDTNSANWYYFDGPAFTGSFDGNGKRIINLTIDDSGAGNDYLGLFGYIEDGEIRNLGLEGGDVSGEEYIGSLLGCNVNGSVSNCYSTGDVNGEIYIGGLVGLNGDGGSVSNCCSTGSVIGSSRVGGLVGYNREIISKCYSTGDVSGDERVGGLVGYNLYGSVSNCYSTGDITGGELVSGLVGYNNRGSILNCCSIGSVSGVQDVGGLVGYNRFGSILNCCSIGSVSGYSYIGGLVGGNDNYCSVSNSYSAGSVSGYSYVGGLVGINDDDGSISNCYSTGDVNGVGYVGGLVGCNYSYVSSCFWDTDTQTHGVTRGIGLNPGGTIINVLGLTTTEMQIKSTFTDSGWDFITPVWTIEEGVDYPRLCWERPLLHAEPEVTVWTSNRISWEPVVGSIEYYAECAEDVNFTNIVYNSGWITETSHEFTGLQLGQRYWYRVKARNSAGMESQWSNVESSLQGSLAEAIEIVLESINLKSENLKKPYINKINTAQEMIDSGNFTSALNKLENDILQKTDGCAETGEPDGDDWIITCEEQGEVYPLVIETIDYVKSLIQ